MNTIYTESKKTVLYAQPFLCAVRLILLVFLASCTGLIPTAMLRLPEHFAPLEAGLRVELSAESGPLALYQVHWQGEELLPLGYTSWTGEITAEAGPGVALLIELYPDGNIPHTINLELIVEAVEELNNPWGVHPQWLAETIEADDLRLLRSFESDSNRAENYTIDFSTQNWISTDPLDAQIYSGRVRLALAPGELRRYIQAESEEVFVVFLSPSGSLRTSIRPARKQ